MNQAQVQRTEDRDISTVLINSGIRFVKRNPIPVSFYIIGMLLAFFFSGFSVDSNTQAVFEKGIQSIDWREIEIAKFNMEDSYSTYYRSKGWFSCDEICKINYEDYKIQENKHKILTQNQKDTLREMKGKVGIFSNYGVSETKSLFSQYFSAGKQFATRQSKW